MERKACPSVGRPEGCAGSLSSLRCNIGYHKLLTEEGTQKYRNSMELRKNSHRRTENLRTEERRPRRKNSLLELACNVFTQHLNTAAPWTEGKEELPKAF